MLSMVSGSVLLAEPADGLIFLLEPSRPLAATILRTIEDLTAADAAHDLRDRRAPALLGRVAVAGRLGRQAAHEVRGAGMMDRRASAPGRGARARPAWRLRDRIGLASPGRSACCSAPRRGDRRLHAHPGHQVRPPRPVRHPSDAGYDEADTGGFLDPLIGTFCSPRWRWRSPCRWAWRSRCGSASTAARSRWRAWPSRRSR